MINCSMENKQEENKNEEEKKDKESKILNVGQVLSSEQVASIRSHNVEQNIIEVLSPEEGIAAKIDDDLNAAQNANIVKSNEEKFVEMYLGTGDLTLSVSQVYGISDEGARLKGALLLKDEKVMKLLDKNLENKFTLNNIKSEAYSLYKKCVKEGNRIKALELLSKLCGYLNEKNIVNNNYQTWNTLIMKAHAEQEREGNLQMINNPVQ